MWFRNELSSLAEVSMSTVYPFLLPQFLEWRNFEIFRSFISLRIFSKTPSGLQVVYQTVVKVKVKWSRYRPGVAQRVGRRIALLFHDRSTRRGWLVSSTPRPRKDPVPILQEAGWAPGPVWKHRKPRPHRDLIPDRPDCSQSLYRLSYPGHIRT